MKDLIKKILKESEWDWTNQFSNEVLLSDYVNLYKIKNLEDLIGLKVMISKDSEYYDEMNRDESNPINEMGEITHIDHSHSEYLPIHVKWPSWYETNTYNVSDLITFI